MNESTSDDGNMNPREDNNTNTSNNMLCPNQHPSTHAQAVDTQAQEFQPCRLGDIYVKVRTVKEGPEGRGGEAPDDEEKKMQDWEEEKEAPYEEGQEV